MRPSAQRGRPALLHHGLAPLHELLRGARRCERKDRLRAEQDFDQKYAIAWRAAEPRVQEPEPGARAGQWAVLDHLRPPHLRLSVLLPLPDRGEYD